jgi:hypothetical protein
VTSRLCLLPLTPPLALSGARPPQPPVPPPATPTRRKKAPRGRPLQPWPEREAGLQRCMTARPQGRRQAGRHAGRQGGVGERERDGAKGDVTVVSAAPHPPSLPLWLSLPPRALPSRPSHHRPPPPARHSNGLLLVCLRASRLLCFVFKILGGCDVTITLVAIPKHLVNTRVNQWG